MPRNTPSFETEKQPFATRLSTIMRTRKTTQEALAQHIGVKRQTISLYTNGQSEPNATQIIEIADFFDVSADWLLGISNYTRNKSEQIMAKDLGLSEESIEILENYAEIYGANNNLSLVLDQLIEEEGRGEAEYIRNLSAYPSGMSERDGLEYGLHTRSERMEELQEIEQQGYTFILSKISQYLWSPEDHRFLFETNSGLMEILNFDGASSKVKFDPLAIIKMQDVVENVLLSEVTNCLKVLRRRRLASE